MNIETSIAKRLTDAITFHASFTRPMLHRRCVCVMLHVILGSHVTRMYEHNVARAYDDIIFKGMNNTLFM